MRISLVGTVHTESGRANVAELEAILGRIQPDVIFVEIPSAHLADHLNCSRGSLESTAVVRYRERRPVNVVPVDLNRPNDQFFINSQEMFNKVERTSPDYRVLMDRHSLDTRDHGFPYLNSDRCAQAWANIYGEVLATIKWIGDAQLRQIYDLWSETNDRRDTGMLKNIDDYCVRHALPHGVLLVGAAHRTSIVDKVRGQRDAVASGVAWDLEGSLSWMV
jgi:hypothetical protein